MPAVNHSFVGKKCNLALHSAGVVGNVKSVTAIRFAAGILAYTETGSETVYHTSLPFVIEELSDDKE